MPAGAPGTPAFATDFVVSKTADSADGVCNADCSLREAIVAANASPGADRIILGSGLTYTLTLGPADPSGAIVPGSGDLDVTDALTIDGNGSSIDAALLDRVLDIQGSFTRHDQQPHDQERSGERISCRSAAASISAAPPSS